MPTRHRFPPLCRMFSILSLTQAQAISTKSIGLAAATAIDAVGAAVRVIAGVAGIIMVVGGTRRFGGARCSSIQASGRAVATAGAVGGVDATVIGIVVAGIAAAGSSGSTELTDRALRRPIFLPSPL